MTDTELSAASSPVLEEVGVQLDLLDVFGNQYARDCLAHALGLRPRPIKPRGMHQDIARALRDIAADEAVAFRLYGPRRDRTERARRRRAAA